MASTLSGRVSVNFAPTISFPSADKPGSGGLTVNVSAMTENQSLGSTQTPPTSKCYFKQLSSTTTIDLTAAVSEDQTIDGTGLKVQKIFLRNNDTTNTATVADGAANAYQLQGGQSILLQPDSGWAAMAFKDNLADVDATHKNITVTITAGTVDVCIILG